MTKTKAREYLRRAREGIRDAEQALKDNDAEALLEALQEVGGAAGTIESSLVAPLYSEPSDGYGDGVAGLLVESR